MTSAQNMTVAASTSSPQSPTSGSCNLSTLTPAEATGSIKTEFERLVRNVKSLTSNKLTLLMKEIGKTEQKQSH